MPWKKKGSGYTTKSGGFVKDPAKYEALKRQGHSKASAAAIANDAINKGYKKGVHRSGKK